MLATTVETVRFVRSVVRRTELTAAVAMVTSWVCDMAMTVDCAIALLGNAVIAVAMNTKYLLFVPLTVTPLGINVTVAQVLDCTWKAVVNACPAASLSGNPLTSTLVVVR